MPDPAPKRPSELSDEERYPTVEITETFQEIAGIIDRMKRADIRRFQQRGTIVQSERPGRFSLSIRDTDAPDVLQNRFFYADFETGHFDSKNILASAELVLSSQAADIDSDYMRQPRTPVSDATAAALLEYLQERE